MLPFKCNPENMSGEYIVAYCFIKPDLHLKYEKQLAQNTFLCYFTPSQMTRQNSNQDRQILHFFLTHQNKASLT